MNQMEMARLCKELRKETGINITDCKKILIENNWSLESARDYCNNNRREVNKKYNRYVYINNVSMDIESLEKAISTIIKKTTNIMSNFMNTVKNVINTFKPFFEEYGYDIKYLNKVIHMAKHAKKKRVRNKYRNMIKRTLGEEKLNRILEVE